MIKLPRFFVLTSISLFSIIATLFALEIIVRKFAPEEKPHTRFSPFFIYENIPNSSWSNSSNEFNVNIKYNSDGLRDVDYKKIKDTNIFRIAVVGDSFAVGEQVNLEETFPKQLEKLLNSRTKKDFEVINFGVRGYNIDSEIVLLKERVKEYHPDLVILTFFFNDLDGLVNSPLISIKEDKINYDYLEKIKKETVFSKLGRYVVSRSRLWDYLINEKLASRPKLAINFYKIKAKLVGGETIGDVQNQRSINRWIGFRYYSPTTVRTFIKDTPQDIDSLWNQEKIVLNEFKNISKSFGADFMVIVATAPLQFRQEKIDEALNFYELPKDNFDPLKPNREITKIAKDLNIPILDLYKTIEKNEISGNLMHFKNDVHWNKQGSLVVAQEIYKFLTDN